MRFLLYFERSDEGREVGFDVELNDRIRAMEADSSRFCLDCCVQDTNHRVP